MNKAVTGGWLTTAFAVRPSDISAVNASRCSDWALHDAAFVNEWIMQARHCASLKSMLVPLDAIDGWKRNKKRTVDRYRHLERWLT